MPDARQVTSIIDADYEVVGGGYQIGEEHRREKGWYFTGKYDRQGYPLFRRSRLWFEARALGWIGLVLGGVVFLGVVGAAIDYLFPPTPGPLQNRPASPPEP